MKLCFIKWNSWQGVVRNLDMFLIKHSSSKLCNPIVLSLARTMSLLKRSFITFLLSFFTDSTDTIPKQKQPHLFSHTELLMWAYIQSFYLVFNLSKIAFCVSRIFLWLFVEPFCVCLNGTFFCECFRRFPSTETELKANFREAIIADGILNGFRFQFVLRPPFVFHLSRQSFSFDKYSETQKFVRCTMLREMICISASSRCLFVSFWIKKQKENCQLFRCRRSVLEIIFPRHAVRDHTATNQIKIFIFCTFLFAKLPAALKAILRLRFTPRFLLLLVTILVPVPCEWCTNVLSWRFNFRDSYRIAFALGHRLDF